MKNDFVCATCGGTSFDTCLHLRELGDVLVEFATREFIGSGASQTCNETHTSVDRSAPTSQDSSRLSQVGLESHMKADQPAAPSTRDDAASLPSVESQVANDRRVAPATRRDR